MTAKGTSDHKVVVDCPLCKATGKRGDRVCPLCKGNKKIKVFK